jgi:cell division protein FtsW
MKKKRFLLSDFYEGFIPFFSIVGAVFLLLAFQPDFWSILIIAPITIAMYYIGGGNSRYIGISLGICLVWAMSVYGIGKIPLSNSEWKNQNPIRYISQRIDNFLSNNKNAISSDTINYQTKQGLIAIWSGGFFGLGFGKSIQKFGYLPEVQGDFIFSVIVEELWFIGAFLLFIMYLAIAYRGFTIARSVKDLFAQYTAFGITSIIMLQAFVNIGVNLNIVPLTGVTLPFVSYGWSSLFSLMIAVGILLSISRHAEYRPTKITDILSPSRRVSI